MNDHPARTNRAGLSALLMLAGACGASVAAELGRGPDAKPGLSPEYFETNVIQKWQADGTQGLWMQIAGGRWLYAKFLTPCTDLPTSVSARLHWSLSAELEVGASVKTAAGSVCAVRRIDEVKAAGSTAPIDGPKAGTQDADLEGVVVEGRGQVPDSASKDVPRCGVRSIVWALTRPGSAWRLVTPVENVGPATACLGPSASGYRWSSGIAP